MNDLRSPFVDLGVWGLPTWGHDSRPEQVTPLLGGAVLGAAFVFLNPVRVHKCLCEQTSITEISSRGQPDYLS